MSVDSIIPTKQVRRFSTGNIQDRTALPVKARRFSTGNIKENQFLLGLAPIDPEYMRRVEALRDSSKKEQTMGYTTFHTKRSRETRAKQIFRDSQVLSVPELTKRLVAFKYSKYEVGLLLSLCKRSPADKISFDDFLHSYTSHAFQTQKQDRKGRLKLGHSLVSLSELQRVARTYTQIVAKKETLQIDEEFTLPFVIRSLYPTASPNEVEHAAFAVERLESCGNAPSCLPKIKTPAGRASSPSAEAEALFHAFDVDDSGLLSIDEFAKGQLRHIMSDSEAACVFAAFDEDKNCMLTPVEFTRFYHAMRERYCESNEAAPDADDTELYSWLCPRPSSPRPSDDEEDTLKALFESYDSNSDGLLSYEELRTAFKGIMSRKEVAALMAQYHADSDCKGIDFTGFKRLSAGHMWGGNAAMEFYKQFYKGRPVEEVNDEEDEVPLYILRERYTPQRPSKLPPIQAPRAPTRRRLISSKSKTAVAA